MILLIQYKYKYRVEESVGRIEGGALLHEACDGLSAFWNQITESNWNN